GLLELSTCRRSTELFSQLTCLASHGSSSPSHDSSVPSSPSSPNSTSISGLSSLPSAVSSASLQWLCTSHFAKLSTSKRCNDKREHVVRRTRQIGALLP